ncbi:MAG: Vi polysaccharide biosynthesis UDP-N-acetylglucosamine C-6 dehydrogenase TviB, partial [Bacteroidales bacterium]|nr:Vi polysaccharide biosynthesis UDP-N-acetylglucosamine C-6 dehydrogenase TviB [Bacteroidales bacterium]
TIFWSYNCEVEIYDPWADFDEVKEEYGIELLKEKADLATYDAIVAAVSHRELEELNIGQYSRDGATVIYDIKGALPKEKVDARL